MLLNEKRLRSVIRQIIQENSYKTDLKKNWSEATDKLKKFLEISKNIEQLKVDNPGLTPDQLDLLRKGGKKSGTVLPNYKLPAGTLKSFVNTWISLSKQWIKYDADQVNDEYEILLKLYKEVPNYLVFADNQEITNKENPFAGLFEKSISQTYSPKGGSPSTLQLNSGVWTPWSPTNEIPFDPSSEDRKEKIGPGERKLAAELGTDQVMGGGYSYDIAVNGYRYEVKAVSSDSKTIRAAKEGMKLYAKPRKKIEEVLAQISLFNEKYKQMFGETPFTRQISEFISSELPGFESSDATGDRLSYLIATIHSIKDKIESLGGNLSPSELKKFKIIDSEGEVEYVTPTKTYLTILDMLGTDVRDMDKKQKVNFLSSILKSKAFIDPDAFNSEIISDMDPTSSFSEVVDGLFIVSKKGYFYMDINDIRKYLRFLAVYQGRPNYVFTEILYNFPIG